VSGLLRISACLILGLALGGGGALVLDQRDDPASDPAHLVAPTPSVAPGPDRPRPEPDPAPDPGRDGGVLLAWTAGGLPPGYADAVRSVPQVEDVTVVQGGLLGLVGDDGADGAVVQRVTPGWEIPLDVLGVDPTGYRGFAEGPARRAIGTLAPGEALLGETSARLRGIGVGGRLLMTGNQSVVVAGVVPDVSVAGAEVVVSLPTAADLGITTDRFLLLHHRGPRAPVDAAVRALAGEAVRTRARGETPYLRHADAVLPQALIKARFGEFAYQRSGSGPITIDPAWLAENIVETDLPVLGHVRCHRGLIPALRGAIDDLVAANLGHLIASFEGCFNARTIAGTTQLSRHAWGAAVDLNFSANPTGVNTAQDPRLVSIFEQWGFGSGDLWLVPDSGHFEYISPPTWKVVP
jgi:D-alanyl-D-alanine carboxypeptidase